MQAQRPWLCLAHGAWTSSVRQHHNDARVSFGALRGLDAGSCMHVHVLCRAPKPHAADVGRNASVPTSNSAKWAGYV